MSRKFILSLAAATIVIAGLTSTAADARGFGGGTGGGRSFAGARLGGGNHFNGRGGRAKVATLNPGRGHHGGNPGGGHGRPPRLGWHHHHHHLHRIFRNGIWIDGGYEEVDGTPDVAAAPGPCTCLTKTYTPTGLVIFADVCTKEAASARVDGTAADATTITPAEGKASETTPTPANAPTDTKAADLTKVPTSPNYAGLTYADYLAANPQLAAKAPKN